MPIPSNDYDVGQAFKRIEEELIASMMKNMKRHTDWETDEGFQWEMWQALQLQALEKYRKENPEKFKGEFEEINKMIPEAIKMAREHGQMDQEIEILEAIKKGWKPPELDKGLSGAFFRLNDRKLNALIEATTGDFEKAEAAILRKANDNYRKIIFSAQVYANTGAATYEKAVDMATKDFLAAGINCIEYKNGSRHTLEDYCDMALRTAQKRAYLAGEGEKRQEWGIHTVIMNKRGQGQPCPLCLPFVGKIMIDDVYGGGSRKDGPYKLLSEAMAAGLYHPRCRDSHTAYFPDIDEEEKLTREEVQKTKEDYMTEEEANYCSRQEAKYGRLAEHSLDPENQRKYGARRDAWGEKAEQLQIKLGAKEETPPKTALGGFTPAETIEAAQGFAQRFIEKQFMDRTFKGEANFKGISVDHANAIGEALTEVYERFPEMEKLSGIKVVSPKSKQGQKAFPGGEDALFSYDPIQHGIYVNKDVLKNAGTLDEYMKRSQDAWDLIMENLDKLSGPQRELAERYAKAGRSLVSGDTVKGLFIHELGHHAQWTMMDPKTTNLLTSRMSQFAPKISGYAQASNSEYLAESFAAYMRGERRILDPEYVRLLDAKLKPTTLRSISKAKTPEFIMDFNVVLEKDVEEVLLEEYRSWRDSLTGVEFHAVKKYTKNSFDDVKPKFFERLNAMLRGDRKEDPELRRYANIISYALKRKPLENDIICYRRVNHNPFEGMNKGDEKIIPQFFSTSIKRGATINGKYEITLFVRKGTRGAFLDKDISEYPEQLEFLIDKDTKYRIMSVRGNKIVVEVIP